MTNFLEHYAVVVVFYAAIPANLFPLTFAWRPWHRSFLGRAVMVKAVAVALLIDGSIVEYLWPNYFGDDLVQAFIFTLVATGITLQYLALAHSRFDRDLSDEHRDE